MKLNRLFCLVITLLMVMTLGTSALAEAYIHPSGAYGFTIPNGWYAVDEANLSALIQENKLAPEMESIFAQNAGTFFTMVLDGVGESLLFRDNINFIGQDLGQPLPVDDFLEMAREQLPATITAQFPDAQILVPAQIATFGDWRVIVHSYQYTYAINETSAPLVCMQVYLSSGNMMYVITLTCKPESAGTCGRILDEVIAGFFEP